MTTPSRGKYRAQQRRRLRDVLGRAAGRRRRKGAAETARRSTAAALVLALLSGLLVAGLSLTPAAVAAEPSEPKAPDVSTSPLNKPADDDAAEDQPVEDKPTEDEATSSETPADDGTSASGEAPAGDETPDQTAEPSVTEAPPAKDDTTDGAPNDEPEPEPTENVENDEGEESDGKRLFLPRAASAGNSTVGAGSMTFSAYVGAGENLDLAFTKIDSYATVPLTINIRPPGGGATITCTVPAASTPGASCSRQNLTAPTAGIWEIELELSSGTWPRLRWTINVQNGAATIPGRVFTDRYVMWQDWRNNNPSNALNPDPTNVDLDLWYVGDNGYQYATSYNIYNGNGSTFTADGVGNRVAGTCVPAYRSLNTDGPNVDSAYQPASGTDPCGEPYKIFFEAPAADLPESATRPDGSTDWVQPAVTSPAVSNLAFAPAGGGTHAGVLSFDVADHTGAATVLIDTDGDGTFNGPADVSIPTFVTPGSNSVDFNGLDAAGDPVPSTRDINAQVLIDRAGEIHFVNTDVERRSGGIEVTALNGAEAGSTTIHWDDRFLTLADRCSITAERDGRAGVDSTGGVHNWGRCSAADGFGNVNNGVGGSWGDYRAIDDWMYHDVNVAADLAIPGVELPDSTCNVAPNGSFEQPNIQDNPNSAFVGGYALYLTNQAAISGWNVVSGTVDILRWYANASDGVQSIDMYGVSPGTLQQTFNNLTPGVSYTFSLDYAGLSTTASRATVSLDPGTGFANVQTLTPAAAAVPGGTPPGQTTYNATWETFTHTFTATSTSATIRIANQATPGPSGTGLFIDNFQMSGPCSDYGDAPRSYGTQRVDDGPRHLIAGYDAGANTAPLMLGSLIDDEADGPFAGGAITDDDTAQDDEDGVGTIAYEIGQPETVDVEYTNDTGADATLAGWIDLDRNGTFDAGELQTASVPSGTGSVSLTFPVLTGPGNTYARFRLFTGDVSAPSPTGTVTGGEVEDHRVFGPPTVLTCSGPPNGSFEEPNVDEHPDSFEQPAGFALWLTNQSTLNGWNVTDGSVDILRGYNNASDGAQSLDLWGVSPGAVEQSFTGLVVGEEYTFSIDYSGLSTTESVATVSLDTGAGFTDLQTLTPVANATPGTPPSTPRNIVTWATYTHTFTATSSDATIRIANRLEPGPSNTGLFIDNFQMTVPGCDVFDFGDAPASYGTTLAADGPRHPLPGYDANSNTAPVMLGSLVDDENDGVPSPRADSDDANPAGRATDEDGVAFNPTLGYLSPTIRTGVDPQSQQPMENTLEVEASADGFVSVWIDFNMDGDWADAGEQVANAQAVMAGTNEVTFSQGTNPPGVETYVRVRYSTDAASIADPTGAAPDGEVEDYRVLVERLVQPDACTSNETDYYAFTFGDPVAEVSNAGAVGTRVRYENVSVIGGVLVDVVGEVVSGSLNPGIRPPNGFGDFGGAHDDAAWTTGNATIRYSFYEAGTTTPVDVNAVFTVNDLDGPPANQEVATFDAADLSAYAVTQGSAVVVSESGGNVTFRGTENSSGGPNSRFQIVLEGLNSFESQWAGGTSSGFSFDGDGDLSIEPPACEDFGDAPNSFGTDLASNGPRHTIAQGLLLGSEIDFDPDGQPTAGADGDDTNRLADEDAFESPVILQPGVTSASLSASVTNSTGGAARLYGWIDVNGNGVFEASEFATAPAPAGATSVELAFSGMASLQDGTEPLVRLRLTSDALVDNTATAGVDERALGAAPDGEVEDHLARVATVLPLSCTDPYIEDFGAGSGFGPALPAGHTTYQYVGSRDPDGQMDANEYALVPSPFDTHDFWHVGEDHTPGDTDGHMMAVNADVNPGIFFQRTFTGLTPGALYDFSAWISNIIDIALPVLPNVTFRVVDPATGNELASVDTGDIPRTDSLEWERYALQFTATQPTIRLELVNNSPGSLGNDIGIDDITFMPACEFGDAPDTYGTTIASGGAGHVAAGPTLGTERDNEPDGQPGTAADGDDTTATADEDGVATPLEIIVNEPSSVTVSATNDTDEDVTLAGWIDLDGNGTFDAGELVTVVVPANSGTADYQLDFPAGTTVVDTYARFRIYPGIEANPVPTGTAAGGEVEDYLVTVLVPELESSKTVEASDDPAVAGSTLTYTLTFENVGTADAAVDKVDNLSHVLDDAELTAAPAVSDAALSVSAVADGQFSITGTLAPGQIVTVTYTVTVRPDGERGDNIAANYLVDPDEEICDPADPECDPPPCEPAAGELPDCTVTRIPEIVDYKSVVASDDPVVAGSTLTYTLTFENTGEAPGAVDKVDNLLHVLDDADVTAQPSASDAALTVSAVTGGEFSVTGTLAAGQTVTVSYTVTVKPDGERGDNIAANYLVDPDEEICDPADPECEPPPCEPAEGELPDCTLTPIPEIVDSKSVVASDDPVVAGSTLTYTLTFENLGEAAGAVDKVDNLLHVLDDAELTAAPAASDAALSVSVVADGQFSISGTLAAGQTVTVTYTVTVRPDGERGDNIAANYLAEQGTEICDPADEDCDPPPCVPAVGEEPDCTVTPIAEIVDHKSVVASDDPVVAGSTLTYTLTFENTGEAAGAVDKVDNLLHVLDDADVTTQPAASDAALSVSAVTGGEFSITGTLAAGQTVTVTYTVTVKPDGERGDNIAANYLVEPGTEICDPADEDCDPPPCEPAPDELPDCTVTPIAEIVDHKSVEASDDPVVAGSTLTYTLTFENVGQAPGAVDKVDNLLHVLDDADLTAAPAASDAALSVSAVTGGEFSITGTLAAGQTVTVSYTVTVKPDAERGDNIAANYLVEPGTEICDPADEDCDPPPCEPAEGELPDCTVTPIGEVVDSKSVVASDDPVVAGSTLTYTLAFENTGEAPGAVDKVDNLTHVLDDADLTAAPSASDAALSVSAVADGQFSITGTLAAGQTVTVSYTVTVKPDAERGDNIAANYLVEPGTEICDPADEDCDPPPCEPAEGELPDCTVTPISEVVDSKSVEASDDPVVAGSTLTYTLAFENTGEAPGAVDKVDNLTHVLDDADLTAAPAASDAALSVSAVANGQFSITGTLTPGQIVTVTYTVTVKPDGERGDNVAANYLVGPGTEICDPADEDCDPPPCEPAEGELPDCTVTPIGEIVDWKTVDPASTTPVTAGQELTYTVTFENIGEAPAAVDKVDSLLHILDDATVTSPPTPSDPALTVAESDEQYSITGTLAAGQTVTVSYTVTVRQDGERGDDILANFLLDPGENPPTEPVCEPVEGELPDCTVNPVGQIKAAKSVDPASGTEVGPGDELTFTLTFENVGQGPAAVDYTDHAAGVADDADLVSQPAASDEALAVSELENSSFTVTGELAAGQTATVTYTVRVRDYDEQGDGHLLNFLTPTGEEPPSECVATNPLCTHNPIEEPPPGQPGPGMPDTGADTPALLLAVGLGLLLGGLALANGMRGRALTGRAGANRGT